MVTTYYSLSDRSFRILGLSCIMIEMVKSWHTNPKGQRRIPPTTLQASLYIIIALTHYTKEHIDNK